MILFKEFDEQKCELLVIAYGIIYVYIPLLVTRTNKTNSSELCKWSENAMMEADSDRRNRAVRRFTRYCRRDARHFVAS
jgi:hypothetical protein